MYQNHRTLIFQGGGALGAYEAGIYNALYDHLIEDTLKENKQLFDIVAGTSAGAINATLLVNHVHQNKNKHNPWKGSTNVLYQFWQDVSTDMSYLEISTIKFWQNYLSVCRDLSNNIWNPIFNEFDRLYEGFRENPLLLPYYYLWPDRYGKLATYESFRRYWSWYQFSSSPFGTYKVLSPGIIQPDFRFLNPFNFMIRYDNSRLTKTISNYWDHERFPIKTIEGEPRLLLVAIDIQGATTVTFDSYHKKDNQLITVYSDEENNEKHIIRYKEGIKMEHLLTSMSTHLRYKFPELNVTTTTMDENELDIEDNEYPRPFMDGFYLSNTPLREVLQAHRDYWYKVKGMDENVPSLDIYIGDLYTAKEMGTPEDPDSINNRIQNVLYHDKSKYDEKVAAMISDYIYVIKDLVKMVNEKGLTEKVIYDRLNNDLKNKLRSTNRQGDIRSIEDLINGRANINSLQRIEYGSYQNLIDSDDIYRKAFEFSKHTIDWLFKKGYNDACIKCNFQKGS